MGFYNKECGRCGENLVYIGKEFGTNYRFDLFSCPFCKKEYIVKTSISGESVFEKGEAKNSKPLTKDKKKILEELMGRASSKQIDFNKVRDEWRDSNENCNE